MVTPLCLLHILRCERANEFALEASLLGVDEIGESITHVRGDRLPGQHFRQPFTKLVCAGRTPLHVTQSRHCGPPLWATFV